MTNTEITRKYYIGRKVYRTRDMTIAAFDEGRNMAGTVTEHHGLYIRVQWNDGTGEWLTGRYLPYAPTA